MSGVLPVPHVACVHCPCCLTTELYQDKMFQELQVFN